MARLDDILTAREGNANIPADLAAAFAAADASDGRDPLPAGRYTLNLDAGGYAVNPRTGSPSYKLHLSVADGPHAGRKLWHDCYLTPKALNPSKRDLARIGVVRLDQAPPPGIVLDATVALLTRDDGRQKNEVANFVVVPRAPGVPAARRPDLAAFAPPGPDLSPRPEDLAAPAPPAAPVDKPEVNAPAAPAPVVAPLPPPPAPVAVVPPAPTPEDPILAAVAAARRNHPDLEITTRPGLDPASVEVAAARADGLRRSVTVWSPILASDALSRLAILCDGLIAAPSLHVAPPAGPAPVDPAAAIAAARAEAARLQAHRDVEGGAS